MTVEKIRIYELAKKLKLSNKEVIDLIGEKLKMQVKSHASTITQEEADKLISLVSNVKAPKKEEKSPASAKPSPEKKELPEKIKTEVQKEETKPVSKEQKIGQPSQRPERPSYDRQGPRPERPSYDRQGPRPERPSYDRQGPRPERPSYDRQGPRPERPHYDRQGPRPERPSYDRQGPRPERPSYDRQGGPRPDRPSYDRQGPRPERPSYDRQGPRPERPHYDRQGPRPERPSYDRQGGPRPERPPYDRQGPRPERPAGERQHQAHERSDNRPGIPTKKPVIPRTEIEVAKTPGRRDIFGKKKEKHKEKEDFLSKSEKIEQSKLIQDKFKKKKKEEKKLEKEVITEVFIDKPLTVGELADKMGLGVSDVIKQLMMNKILATVNQTIDTLTAKNLVEALGFTVIKAEKVEEKAETEVAEEKAVLDESRLQLRAPVVTIMGHVDHGKTTLLDSIRSIKHKIVNTEVGGITQSIGAYTVRIDERKIVFIDTPGHEAFTAMRARGSQATDIAILVVAADDGIMPQTIESINHAKAAKVPIIVAVNKIDKVDSDSDRVLQQLTEYDLVPEKWGGDTVCVPVSAIQGTNIDELLEMILLVAEMEDLKTDYNKNATGVVIEAKLDKGKGAVATLLVQAGTLKVGDCLVTGNVCGKVRALISDEGERIKEAGPSTPVEILGLTEVPQAGDTFEVVDNEKVMKTIITRRREEERTSRLDAITPAQIRKEMLLKDQEETKDLNIIIKANSHGSAEAVSAALQQLVSKQIFVKIVHVGIGDISEADVMLASASNAIVLGFAVKEDPNALKIAASSGIDIRKYDIIYQILEDIEKTMLGLLQPEIKEVEIGTAEVRQVFTVGKNIKIAGCYVLDGKIVRNKVAKVIRNGKEIYKGVIDQLKRFKDDVKEVASGYECGISFSKFNDIEEGDIIRVSTIEEIEREVLV